MRKRVIRNLAMFKLGVLLCALPFFAAQAQLPFDPSAIDQLTPEQRQQALEALGQSNGSQAQSRADGSFRDRPLLDPSESRMGQTGARDAGNEQSRYRGRDDGCDDRRDDRRSDGRYDADDDRLSDLGRDNRSARDERDARSSDRPSGCDDSASRKPRLRTADDDSRDDVDERQRGRLKPFGYELFATAATTFAPATDIPIPSNYVLGPGDSIRVQLFGNENANYSLQVSRDGRINFPKLGPISVAGQRFENVQTMLTERVSRELIGVQSSISLGELRSVRVFLLGDVNQPGSYTVSSLSTITNALFVGGGVSEVGSLRNIQLKRSGRVVQTLDLYALLLRGDSSADVRLLPGDVIFVPPVGARISADGELKRPAIYELKGEKTVADVIALAGGLLASTNTGTAQIERFDGNQKKIQQVDVGKAGDLGARVQDGDLLRVGEIARRLENKLRVIGYVKYPGAYQWQSGYDLKAALGVAQIQASDTAIETYLALGLIERTDPRSGVRGWISFNVQAVLAADAAPFPLQQDDLVIILNREDVAYLDSREVRAVAAGDLRPLAECPALEGLARLANSERSVRFLKSFTAESARTGESARTSKSTDATSRQTATPKLAVATVCPEIFRKAPRALQYLLEESVAVYGEVRRPGLYPIAPNTPLALLVETAGGLSNESDAANIEYISYGEALKTGQSSYRTLDLRAPGTEALKTNPGDVFNFKPLYLGQEVGTVRALGEFRFPGAYGILRGERLSELIKRAGGLTANSYVYGAVFTRESARLAEEESYRRAAADLQEAAVTAVTSGALGKDAQVSAQFLGTVAQRLQDAKAVGRVVIDADPAALEKRPEIDPILEPGDALIVPKRPISVTVIGQVLNPGSLAFAPETSLKQYVDRAGGYAQAADISRVFVILPNGTAQKIRASFWTGRAQDIPAGSMIVVPRDAAPFNAAAFAERAFGLLSNLALTAAALATITRQ